MKNWMFVLLMIVLTSSLILSGCATPASTPAPNTSAAPATTSAPAPATTSAPAPATSAPATTSATTSAPSSSTAQVQPTVLGYAMSFPSTGWIGEQVQWWADQLQERTGGRYAVKFYWSNSLVSSTDELKATASDLCELSSPSPTFTPAQLPLSVALNNPFNSSDDYAGIMATYDMLTTDPAIKQEYINAGVVPIGVWETGEFQLMLRKPVTSLAGLKGMTVRTFGGGRTLMWKNLGLSPVFMGYSAIYEAMQKGVINAADIVMPLSEVSRHFEVAKAVILINSGMTAGNYIMMNKKVYDGLPQDVKDIITKLGQDYNLHLAQALVGESQRIINEWKTQYGIQFITLSSADMATMKKAGADAAMTTIQQQGQKVGNEAAAMTAWQDYETLVKKYEDQVAANGYPWEQK